MRVWVLAGLFMAFSAPSALALESLTDAPRESVFLARVDTIMPDQAAAKRAAKHNAQRPPQQRTPSERRTAEEARDDEQRRARTDAQRRRRSPAFDRVPDSVLLERRGAL